MILSPSMGTEITEEQLAPVAEQLMRRQVVGAVSTLVGVIVAGITMSPIGGVVAKTSIDRFAALMRKNTEDFLRAGAEVDSERAAHDRILRAVDHALISLSEQQELQVDELLQQGDEHFAQLINFTWRNVVDPLAQLAEVQLETRSLVGEMHEHLVGPLPRFAEASRQRAVPPDLDIPTDRVTLPTLARYIERRLGIPHPDVPRGASPAPRKSAIQVASQHGSACQDHDEDRVLRELVAAAGESDGRMWIVHGEPGSGKTTLITHWVHRWVAGLADPACESTTPYASWWPNTRTRRWLALA